MRLDLMLLLAAVLAGCGKLGCIPTTEAENWMQQGSQHETAGRVHEAWRAYKAASIGPPCDANSQQRTIAGEHRRRLSAEINLAYAATKEAIDDFRAANGHFPESLAEIAGDIPDSARRSFAGFRYRLTPNGELYFLDGYAS